MAAVHAKTREDGTQHREHVRLYEGHQKLEQVDEHAERNRKASHRDASENENQSKNR